MTPSVSRGTSRRRYVLDANALTGFFEDRRNIAEKVRHLLEGALLYDEPLLMSAINWGEVFYIAWRRHGDVIARDLEAKLQELPVAVVSVDRERASRAGALKEKHRLGYAMRLPRASHGARRLAGNGRSGVFESWEGIVGLFVAPTREVEWDFSHDSQVPCVVLVCNLADLRIHDELAKLPLYAICRYNRRQMANELQSVLRQLGGKRILGRTLATDRDLREAIREGFPHAVLGESRCLHQLTKHGVGKPFANRLPQIAVGGECPAKNALSTQLPQHGLKLVCHLSSIVATNGIQRQLCKLIMNPEISEIANQDNTRNLGIVGEIPLYFSCRGSEYTDSPFPTLENSDRRSPATRRVRLRVRRRRRQHSPSRVSVLMRPRGRLFPDPLV